MLSVYLSFSDIICCTSKLVIIIADAYFENEYLKNEFFWRQNFFCYISNACFLIAGFLSIFAINPITLTKYEVIENPLDSNYLNEGYLKKRYIIICIVIVFMVVILFLYYIYTSNIHLMPTGICQLLGHSNESLAVWVLTIATLLSQYFSSIFISIVYVKILRAFGEKSDVQKSSGRQQHIAKDLKVSIVFPKNDPDLLMMMIITIKYRCPEV